MSSPDDIKRVLSQTSGLLEIMQQLADPRAEYFPRLRAAAEVLSRQRYDGSITTRLGLSGKCREIVRYFDRLITDYHVKGDGSFDQLTALPRPREKLEREVRGYIGLEGTLETG